MKSIIAESISKGKKPKNNRSTFLSALMKALGGDDGDQVANAFVGNDKEAFKSAIGAIADKVSDAMPNAKS